MKILGKLLLTLTLVTGVSIYASSQETARVQVIHNSADAAAETVDIWLNDGMLLDDFSFRTSSPFVDLPAEEDIDISILPPDSEDTTGAIAQFTYNLGADEKYILVANGIVSGSGYDPAQPFNIHVYDAAQEQGQGSYFTDLLIHHGVTDAPAIDIYETGFNPNPEEYADNLAYSDFTDYFSVQNTNLTLEITDETGSNTIASYNVPLSDLSSPGSALAIVASGFLNPEDNNNGPNFGLWVALPGGGELIELPTAGVSSTARVQVIHNSADAAAEIVDIWLNDGMLLDDFSFRTSSPFVDLPAGEDIDISILPPDSEDTTGAIAQFTYNLGADEKYILVANGIVSGSGYDPAQPFNIHVYDMARESATSGDNTDVLVAHGSTDASVVDVKEVAAGAGTIVDDIAYSEFQGYLELPTSDYSLQIRDAGGTNTVAQFGAPLETLGLSGEALTVVASGFLNPDNNSGGPAFGLYVALPSGGELVELPAEEISTARVQVIHNSADAAAETVDIWLNDTPLLDDFSFRTASPFIDAPAGEEFTIGVAPANSTSSDDAIATFDYTLTGGEKYLLVANGIVSADGYDPAQPFNLNVYSMARESATSGDNTDVLVAHGSTDAPVVDVKEVAAGAGTIVDDIAYSEFQGYLELPTSDYSLQIRDAGGTNTVAQFGAPLETLGLSGEALTVVASGFLNPDNNSGGPAFGLYVALPSGGELVELPAEEISTARVQVIHNSADAAAETVDIWLNDTPLLDDFSFRTASPFIDAPAGEEFTIGVAPANSTSSDDAIATFDYTLTGGEKYLLVANGIVSADGYDPAEPFNIYVYDMAREVASNEMNTDVLVFHGATDAPTVDIQETGIGAGTLIDNFEYGQFAGYLELGTEDYQLTVADETGESAVAVFDAPLNSLGLQGSAITVLASGFLNPSNNSDGAAFGLYAALPVGGELVKLTNTTGVDETFERKLNLTVYPNPAANYVKLDMQESIDNANIQLVDLTGKVVKSMDASNQVNFQMDVSDLKEGIYLLNIITGSKNAARKIQIIR